MVRIPSKYLTSLLVNEADMIAMSEAHAFIALPTFLADPQRLSSELILLKVRDEEASLAGPRSYSIS